MWGSYRLFGRARVPGTELYYYAYIYHVCVLPRSVGSPRVYLLALNFNSCSFDGGARAASGERPFMIQGLYLRILERTPQSFLSVLKSMW